MIMPMSRAQGTWAFGSALSLKYPRKPKELADDLESFVYIPTYFSLRNHHHCRMLRRDLENKPKPDPQTKDPMDVASFVPCVSKDYEAISLASVMFAFFHVALRHNNGLSSGGDMKFDWIHRARPPVQLNYPEDAVLNDLLRGSFKLLQDQYKSVDYERMEQYLAVQPEPATKPASPLHGPIQYADPREEEMQSLADVEIPVTTAASTSTSTRPLDSHAALLEAFEAVLRPKVPNKRKAKKDAAEKTNAEDTETVTLSRPKPKKRRRRW